MARWLPKPDLPIGSNEAIGRRLFHRPKLKGGRDQQVPAGLFELYHFEETRGDISIDRLGQSSSDRRVMAFLAPRALQTASNLSQARFDGWAVVRARDLQSPARGQPFTLNVTAIAEVSGEPLSDNPYHGDVQRLPTYDTYTIALLVREVFNRHYQHEPPPAASIAGNTPGQAARLKQRVSGWVARILKFLGADR